MADSYPLPGQSIPGRADESPISEENQEFLDREAKEFFDIDEELSSGMADQTERDMRKKLQFKGGMLLQDDDGTVFDAGAIFEDVGGETYRLEVGDSFPGYEEYKVSEIRPGRRGGVEVEFLARRGAPVTFGTGPQSGGRGFGETREKREALERAAELGRKISAGLAEGAAGFGLTNHMLGRLPQEAFEYREEDFDAFDEGGEVDPNRFPPGTFLGTRELEDGTIIKMYSTDDMGQIEGRYGDGEVEIFESGEDTASPYDPVAYEEEEPGYLARVSQAVQSKRQFDSIMEEAEARWGEGISEADAREFAQYLGYMDTFDNGEE
tara:strand:+ start:1185 stop:2153 length:969 start_codon:yes stop_codon:yes gene_type:complete